MSAVRCFSVVPGGQNEIEIPHVQKNFEAVTIV